MREESDDRRLFPAHASLHRGGLWRTRPAMMVAGTYCVLGLVYIAVSDEAVRWVASDSEVLTHIQTWKGWGWIILTTMLIYLLVDFSVRAVRRAEAEQHTADQRFRVMIETTNEGIATVDSEGRLAYVNRTFAMMLGWDEHDLLGQNFRTFLRTQDHVQFDRAIGRDRDGPCRYECELHRVDGSPIWVIVSASPTCHIANGEPATLLMITDISARRNTERVLERHLESQRSLLNELDHRVRNNLSTISSLIDLSRSTADDVDEFASVMSGRVHAMATAHALSSRAGSNGLELSRIVAEMVPHAARSRVSLDGPRVIVKHASVVALAMLIHEMGMNSLQNGALAHASGHVNVSWSLASHDERSDVVLLSWRESPVADGDGPFEAGSLIFGLVERELRGQLSTEHAGTELVHRVRLPFNVNRRAEQLVT